MLLSIVKFFITFPALDNLVSFLRENQQQQIDAMATTLAGLNERLKKSNADLRKAITDEQNP